MFNLILTPISVKFEGVHGVGQILGRFGPYLGVSLNTRTNVGSIIQGEFFKVTPVKI